MKRIIGLLCILTINSTLIAYTNKTFLMPRSQGLNLPLVRASGWGEFIDKTEPGSCGSSVQSTVFYQGTFDRDSMGRYFGVNEHNRVTLGSVKIAGDDGSITNAVTAQDVDILYMIHRYNNGDASSNFSDEVGTVKFLPCQTSYGIFFNYHQNLDSLVKGFYLTVQLPIVRNKHEITGLMYGQASDSNANDIKTLTDYFSGEYSVAVGQNNAQATLKKALIPQSCSVETGVADIDVALGYNILEEKTYALSCNMGLTIPTSNKPRGETLFEVMVGNGGHFGYGLGTLGWVRICGDYDHNLKFTAAVNYRYLFSSDEVRTLGLKGRAWGQYALLGSTKSGENNRGIPAANILTRSLEVLPGSVLDCTSALVYNTGKLSVDLGYSFYFKERETNTVNDSLPTNTYGVLVRNFNFASTTFNGSSEQIDKGGSLLTNDDLDVEASETPRQMLHKFHVGVGYLLDAYHLPVAVGGGAHVAFSQKNSVFGEWGIHTKLSVGF